MTHFKMTVGYECGIDKTVCPYGYPDYCIRCIIKKFSDAHFLIGIEDIEEDDTEEKRQEMNFKYIWRKYQDILNIRHVIILSKGGLPVFNMPVGDHPMDATLLSGFIQANVLFSAEGLTESDKKKFTTAKFYEFQYKHFNILLIDGILCRICLILDVSASDNLRDLLSNFIEIFENQYANEFEEFEKSSNIGIFDSAKILIEKTFEVYMIYPQTLSAQIPPSVIDSFNFIQQAVYEFSKDLLKEKPYFFIPNILNTTHRILGVKSKEEIVWNIYQMIRDNIINTTDLEFQRDEIQMRAQELEKREYEIQKIVDFKSAEVDADQIKSLTLNEAEVKMRSYLKKAEIAEKNLVYSEALNDYRCALTFARGFQMNEDIGKIAFRILEVIKLNKQVELKFAKEQATKFEKKKDYIKALKYLYMMKDILTFDQNQEDAEKQLGKVNLKIQKIQNNIK